MPGGEAMLRRGLPHQRRFYSKPQIGVRTKLLPRVAFRNFSYFVLTLVALAFTPSLYQRFFQVAVKTDCEWLKNPPMVCAHGGDSSRAPPNTHAAYQLAIDAGVDCIEIDASRTWDGVLLALHDRDLKKMSERSSVRVGDLTANQINKLDPAIGFSGTFPDQHVPTVEDAIKYVQQSLKQIIIDAKVGPPLFEERLPADLIFVVKKTECRGCLIWAKDDKVIRDIIRRSPTTKTGYIVMNDTATGKISDLVRFDGAEVVGVYYGLINSKLVKFLHRYCCWRSHNLEEGFEERIHMFKVHWHACMWMVIFVLNGQFLQNDRSNHLNAFEHTPKAFSRKNTTTEYCIPLCRAGRRAYAWTVNTRDTMIEMLKAGVDAIITNDPQLLQMVMQDQKRVCRLNGFKTF